MDTIQPNETAYALRFWCGLFGFCGMAHIYQGRTAAGLVWMFIKGPLYFILAVMVSFTLISALWALPWWLKTVQRQANEGNCRLTVTMRGHFG